MKPIKYVFDACFRVDMGCNLDRWCPFLFTGENVYTIPSCPVSYDKDEDTITTRNTIYKIESYSMNKDKFYAEIEDSIQNGGYKRV